MSNAVLDNPLIECAVKLAIWEKYLKHMLIVPGGVSDATFQEDCNNLQLIYTTYCNLLFLQAKAVMQDLTEEELTEQEDLLTRLVRGWDRVSSYDYIQQQPRDVEDDVFFEELIVSTNRATMNLQNLSKKAENVLKKNLVLSLAELRSTGGLNRNQDEILEIESTVS